MAARQSFLGQAREFLESRQHQGTVIAFVLAPLAAGLFTAFTRYPVDLSDLGYGPALAGALGGWLALAWGLWLAVSRVMVARGAAADEAFRRAARAFVPLLLLPATFPPVVLRLGADVEEAALWLCAGLVLMNLALLTTASAAKPAPRIPRPHRGAAAAFADAVLLAVAAGLGLRLLLLYYNHGFNPWDEGFLDDSASRILTGAVMYKDFQSPWAPGQHYLLALIFRLFGISIFVGKCLRPLYEIPCALGLYVLGRRFMSPAFAFLPALFLLVLGEGSFALLFVLVGFVLAFDLRLSQWAAWLSAGLCIGAAILFKQEVGAWAGLSLALVALIREIGFVQRRFGAEPSDRTLGWAALAPLALGVAAPLVPVAAYFAAKGALGTMIRDLTVYPYSQVLGAIKLKPPPLLPIFPPVTGWPEFLGHLNRLEFYSPGAVYAATAGLLAWRFWRKRLREADMLAAAVLVFGALLYSSAFGRADYYHLHFAAPPAYLLGAYMLEWSLQGLWRAFRRDPRHLTLLGSDVRAAVAVVMFMPMIFRFAALKPHIRPMIYTPGWFVQRPGWVTLNLPRSGGVILPQDEAQALEGLAARVWESTLPTDPIFALPNNPGTYFLTDRHNPTRYPLLYPGVLNEKLQEQASKTLDEDKVKLVVFNRMAWDSQSLDDYMPLLMKHIRGKYRPGERFGDYWVWVRKPAR